MLRHLLPVLLALTACVGPPRPGPPILASASGAFAEARWLERAGRLDDVLGRTSASRAAARALALDPDWIAPRRFLDELRRRDLHGPEVLAAHHAALEDDPEDAAALYLAGRLEGPGGVARFRRAVRIDPASGWAEHGLAWYAYLRRDLSSAESHGRRALALARDASERAHFARTLALYLAALDRGEEVHELLDETQRAIAPGSESQALTVELARHELSSDDEAVRLRGARRAARAIRAGHVELPELDQLVAAARARDWVAAAVVRLAVVEAAAAGLDVPAELALGSLDTPLGARWSAARPGVDERGRRLVGYTHGDAAAAVEGWRASLPDLLLEGGDLPRDALLARVVQSARELRVDPSGEARYTRESALEHADALLRAGWFAEARAFADRLPTGVVEDSLGIVARSQAARLALTGVSGLMAKIDRGEARAPAPLDLSEEAESVRDLDGLLAACAVHLERAAPLLGDAEALAAEFARSPRLHYGMAGQVLHPGPTFSAQDERLGRGTRGEPVPGIAAVFAKLGRFALIGDAFGTPPDATVLRRLLIEERSGSYLGVPWSGTVAWCEGYDFPGRAGRAGALIAGAALHEGYWIDIEPLRLERLRWVDLAAAFSGPDALERVGAALSVRALPCPPDERASTELLLGEADRLRLAVMASRGSTGLAPTGLVPIDLAELCTVTATHEEGHLCDRTRFYPVGEHWPAILGFLLRNGLSPSVVARRLEERAHLVALCMVADPRVPLVDLAQAAESVGGGITPHADAYRVLLGDLLRELDERVAEQPGEWPRLDPEGRLGHQLHRLEPEEVRSLALSLAEKRGLVRE